MAGEKNTSGAAGFVLRVTSQELKNADAELKETIKTMFERYKYILNITTSFASVWEGEAFELNRSQLSSFLDELYRIIAALAIRPDQLEQMAGIYESVESFNQNLIGQLDRDIIK